MQSSCFYPEGGFQNRTTESEKNSRCPLRLVAALKGRAPITAGGTEKLPGVPGVVSERKRTGGEGRAEVRGTRAARAGSEGEVVKTGDDRLAETAAGRSRLVNSDEETERGSPRDLDGECVVSTVRLAGRRVEIPDAKETRARRRAETEMSGVAEAREVVGEAPSGAPTGGAFLDVEAAARTGADGAAEVTNPATSAASAENEGLVSPVPPAAGASGGPEGLLPGGGMFDRPHHRAAFCLEESLPTQSTAVDVQLQSWACVSVCGP